ncbi:MAG: hypothetical protein HY744_13520 [Deltaproteobacteria bacterium]|nr:hypothetical protein [Deltaproteobacteria bacterium]
MRAGAAAAAACSLALAALAAPPARGAGEGETPPAAAPDERAAAEARELYREGAAARREGKLEEARAAYRRAFELKRHYQIATELGSVELDLKHWAEAAALLSFALGDIRRDTGASGEQVQAVAELLRRAQAEVVTVSLEVTLLGRPRADAVVELDGKPALVHAGSLFVTPGEHEVQGRIGGAASRRAPVRGAAGQSQALALELWPSGEGAPVPEQASTGAAGASAGAAPAWLGWTGIGLGAAALGGGVAGLVIASGRGGDADQLDQALRQRTGEPGHAACALYGDEIAADCLDWRSARKERTDAAAAGVGLAVASGAMLGAAAAFLAGRDGGESSPGAPAASASPDAGRRGAQAAEKLALQAQQELGEGRKQEALALYRRALRAGVRFDDAAGAAALRGELQARLDQARKQLSALGGEASAPGTEVGVEGLPAAAGPSGGKLELATAGAALSSAALGVGAALVAGAVARGNDAAEKREALVAVQGSDHCQGRAELCDEISRGEDARDALGAAGGALLAGGVLLGTGTLLYALLGGEDGAPSSGEARFPARLLPYGTAEGAAGLVVLGQF